MLGGAEERLAKICCDPVRRSPTFPIWTRITGLLAALLFGVTALRIAWGAPILVPTQPLPYFAYRLLVATFAGWIWTLLRTDGNATG